MATLPQVSYLILYVAFAYIVVLLAMTFALILWRTFAPGFGQFYA